MGIIYRIIIAVIVCFWACCVQAQSILVSGKYSGNELIAQSKSKNTNKNTGKGKTTTKKNTSPQKKATTAKKNTGQQTNKPKTSAEAKKREEAAKKEIQLTEAQIKENEAKVSRELVALGKIGEQMDSTKRNIQALNQQVNVLGGKIKSLENDIQKNEGDLKRLREEYLKAVKKMRITRKNKSALAYIFSSKSVNEALRRMRYLQEFSKWRGRQTEEITGKVTLLKEEKEALGKARDERQNALALQQKNEAALKEQKKTEEGIVARLKENGKALESHLKRKQAEARDLGNMVSQLIAQEEAAKRKAAEEEAKRKAAEEAKRLEQERKQQEAALAQNKPSETSSQKESKSKDNKKTNKKEKDKDTQYADARKRTPRGQEQAKNDAAAVTAGKDFVSMKGKLPYPSTGSFSVISRFGRQELPDLPGVEYDNPGIDAESDQGASARAVYEGKVSGVYLLPGYNTVVIVNHGNYYTVYGNITSPVVKTGDQVSVGTTLGALASNDEDPKHTTIHFEVWKNREKLNPQDWLK